MYVLKPKDKANETLGNYLTTVPVIANALPRSMRLNGVHLYFMVCDSTYCRVSKT